MGRKIGKRHAAMTAAAIVSVGIAVAGCSSSSSTAPSGSASNSTATASTAASGTTAASGNGKKVAILDVVANGFTECMSKTIATSLSSSGYDPTTYYSSFEPSVSNQNVQDAITKGSVGAVYGSQSGALDAVTLKKLKSANLKTVFFLGTPVSGTSPEATFPVAFSTVGNDAVQELLANQPNVKSVGIVAGTVGVSAGDVPLAAMVSSLAQHGITPVVIHSDWTAQGGAKTTQDMLTAHPGIQALLVMSDDMAIAAARVAHASAGNPPVYDIYGFSGTALSELKSGALAGMVYVPLQSWATEIAGAMTNILAGKPETSTPQILQPMIVNKSNVDTVHTSC